MKCNSKQDPALLPEVQPVIILCCNIAILISLNGICSHGGQLKRTKEWSVHDRGFSVHFKEEMIHFGSSPKPGVAVEEDTGNLAWRIDGVVTVIFPHSFAWKSLKAFSAEHAESANSWPAQFAFCWAQCRQRRRCDHCSLFILQTS